MGAIPTPGRRRTRQPSPLIGKVSGEEQRIASPISVAHTAGSRCGAREPPGQGCRFSAPRRVGVVGPKRATRRPVRMRRRRLRPRSGPTFRRQVALAPRQPESRAGPPTSEGRSRDPAISLGRQRTDSGRLLTRALAEERCLRKAVNECGLNSGPVGPANASPEDQVAMGT